MVLTLVVMMVMMVMIVTVEVVMMLKLVLFDAIISFRYGFLNENFREPLRVQTAHFKTVSFNNKNCTVH